VVSLPAAAGAETKRTRYIRALDRMMVKLGPQSARAARTIRTQYRPHLNLLVLDAYDDLAGALWNGGLAPLPHDALRFNVMPRVDGASPIGEKDLAHQHSYIAARPATIGALLDIASRVRSGPVEVTSLVRHTEYQGALRATNVNATTSVPMHTMGLAIDIALVNTPIETVYEIRDVLIRMRNAGDILFIGERKQLVFHVVPHPARLGHFAGVYARALSASRSSAWRATAARAAGQPGQRAAVSAEVIAVLPSSEFASEWWAAGPVRTDLRVQVVPAAAPPTAEPVMTVASAAMPGASGSMLPSLLLSLAFAGGACRRITRPSAAAALFPQV
jgi:hypothetical protein